MLAGAILFGAIGYWGIVTAMRVGEASVVALRQVPDGSIAQLLPGGAQPAEMVWLGEPALGTGDLAAGGAQFTRHTGELRGHLTPGQGCIYGIDDEGPTLFAFGMDGI